MTSRRGLKRASWRSEETSTAPTQRLEALADGVFAIVMTLLVLGLTVPVVDQSDNKALTEALAEMWPDFLMHALSFLVLGAFWLMHKMMFDSFVTADPPLVWINVLFLMVVSLVPFSTALVGEYGQLAATSFVYGLNMLLAFGFAWGMWIYATRNRRLVGDDLHQVVIAGGHRMGVLYMAIMALVTVLALFAPLAAFIIYALVVGTIIGATAFGRWESVMVWATEEEAAN